MYTDNQMDTVRVQRDEFLVEVWNGARRTGGIRVKRQIRWVFRTDHQLDLLFEHQISK